jgi:hypothetical protein
MPLTLTYYRVPIYSLSSWVSILSLKAAMFVDPIRDVYEVSEDLHSGVHMTADCG